MVNRNLISSLEDDEINSEYADLFPESDEDFDKGFTENAVFQQNSDIDLNKIVKGKILRVDAEKVLIDVGFKSEGSIDRSEWNELTDGMPEAGQEIHVYVEDLEDEFGETDDPFGLISISKTKADHIMHWQGVIEKVKEGDVVLGQVTKKIKGGLLVEIGVPVFLPASQVDIRRPGDIGDYIGRYVQCEVLKIDQERRNIVVSRRALIESERKYIREILLRELKEGDIRKGIVKNIADFGAFVDLGGIDGLLHITDMSPRSYQSSITNGLNGPGDRRDDFEHRSRERKDCSWPEANAIQPMGQSRREVPNWECIQWRSRKRHELRCIR